MALEREPSAAAEAPPTGCPHVSSPARERGAPPTGAAPGACQEHDAALRAYTREVTSLFSAIARVYDPLNRVFSLGLDAWWRKRLVRAVRPFPPSPTGVILDLAAGTLEVTVELARRYPHIVLLAADFCRPMLVRGLPKLRRHPHTVVHTVVADGRRLPLPDASVDAITLAFGLRNMKPREAALAEALRVLVPGGRLCVLEFGSARDKILFGVYNVYLRYVLPQIGRLVSRNKGAYTHLAESIAAFPSADELREEMLATGFATVTYESLTAGIVCLHTGIKQCP